jgi:hypothetical protein
MTIPKSLLTLLPWIEADDDRGLLAPLLIMLFRKDGELASPILPAETVSRVEATALAAAAQHAAGVGEPWLTRLYPDELTAKLRPMGFSGIIHLSPEEARKLL